tara:strand:+ start:2513 stop:4294 length:1782 start_codon:yes stop_codon:yes gene_type:complete
MANIYSWSATPGSNATQGDINFSEGQAPSTLNGSSRVLMSDVAKWRDLISGAKISATADTMTLTSGASLASYAQGTLICFENGATNTTAVTINVDSLGAKAIVKNFNVPLVAGDLVAGGIYIIAYEATAGNFQLLSPGSRQQATLVGAETLTNKTLTSPVLNTGVSGSAILDEDNMASDSATKLASQQSIKAYVDAVAGSATAASTSATLAENYAEKVNGTVETGPSTFSAKAQAVGGTGVTDVTGSAKEWATEVEDNTVAGAGTFSALHHSAKAAAQATAAASSASTASGHATTAQAAAQGWGAVTTITGATTNLEVADARDYYILDASSNTVTINLPAIGSSDGLLYGFQVHNVDNAISIVRDGSDRINGSAANYAGLVAVGQVINFIADDATPDNWLATIISQSSAATATSAGVVELATNAESIAGTDATRAVTPASLHAKTSSATVIGLVELATDAEALTGTDTARALTPANAKAVYSGITRTINAQTGSGNSAYTLVLADAGKIITANNSSAGIITIPPNSSVAFAIGAQIDIYNLGAGIFSIKGGSGVTLNGVSTGAGAMNSQFSAVTCFKIATNTWLMTGAHAVVA